jgi:hypothetical protein
MKVAAYQALLPTGSMDALELIRDRIKWCESEDLDIFVLSRGRARRPRG